MSDRNPERDDPVDDGAQAPVEQPDDDGGAPPPEPANEAADPEPAQQAEVPGPAQQAEVPGPAQEAEVAEPAQQAGAAEVTEPPDPEGGAPVPGEKSESAVEATAGKPGEVAEEPDGDGGAPPPAEQLTPGADKVDTDGKVDTGGADGDDGRELPAADQDSGGDRPGDVGVVHAYLPPSGDEVDPPHAVDGIDYPAYQDDNLGRHAWRDTKAVERGDPVPHRSEEDVAELGRLSRDLRTAPPPDQTLFRGERLEESAVGDWKSAAEQRDDPSRSGEPLGPTENLDVRSTSTDGSVASAYAEERRPGAPPHAADGTVLPEAGASQRHGQAPRPGDGVAAFETSPGEDLAARRVSPEEPVPGYETIAPGLEPGAIAREAEARPENAEALGRLAATIGDDGRPGAAHREGGRREVMNERIVSGDYEMVGLLDTRPDSPCDIGDTGVFRVPTRGPGPGEIEFRPPPPGVYVAWRPVKERPAPR
ncbi:hypothetical protein ACQPX6_25000 [Actinomycetospora sp. CA-101289]|uniref:hypothetical protein n=1 Tax=Actinomycetospora sp. CA-101289 TaxID=3239893 RepID=UPI003D995095